MVWACAQVLSYLLFNLLKVYVRGLWELSVVQLQGNIKGLLQSNGNQVNLIQDEVYRISSYEFRVKLLIILFEQGLCYM